MRLTRPLLDEAVAARALSGDQAAALWAFLERREGDTPSFKPAHILYYLGGLVAVAAVYAVAMLALTEAFLARPGLAIPAGIAATLAVVMVPLGVYGATQMLDLWTESTRVRKYRE